MRDIECLELVFDRERSFLKNILRYEKRRLMGNKYCRDWGSRLNYIFIEVDVSWRSGVKIKSQSR